MHNHIEQRYDPIKGECPACDSINPLHMSKGYALIQLSIVRSNIRQEEQP